MEFDLAKWVLEARKHANLTQEELAFRLGLEAKASISSYEKGRSSPPFEAIWKIGLECRYPLPQNEFNHQSLSQITNTGTQTDTTNNASQITNTGTQTETTNTIQHTTTINNAVSEESEYIGTDIAPDNCMHPVIPQGTRLWVDKKNRMEIQEGKIYLIKLNGWKTVRRLFRLPNQEIRISSQNADYPDEIVPLKELVIVGRVASWKVID